MSIIYDALQKTQQSRELHSTLPLEKPSEKRLEKSHSRVFLVGAWMGMAAIVCAGMLAMPHALKAFRHVHLTGYLFYPIKKAQAPVVKQVALVKPVMKPAIIKPVAPKLPTIKLAVDGVLLSYTENLVMINKHLYHVGDTVGGMRIVSIEFDKVRLEGGNQSLNLEVGA